jgi:hypothetical protein
MSGKMDEHHVVSYEVMAERNETARRVRHELQAAGLPAHIDGSEPDLPGGAEVSVDNGSDNLGGVTVEWVPTLANDPSLRSDSGLMRGKQAGLIARHMNTAIIEILKIAGMEAGENEDDLNPLTVRVASR